MSLIFERGNYDAYAYLIDTKKMVELVRADQGMAENKKQAYEALDYFMQALVFYNATMAMGDVPCSEALKGESEGIVSPQYDTQEEVFGSRKCVRKSVRNPMEPWPCRSWPMKCFAVIKR